MAPMKKVSSFSSSRILGNPLFSQLSQAASQGTAEFQNGKVPRMYFVIPPGETEESCANTNLGSMFETAEAHSLTVQWIEDKDCKTEEFQDGSILVFDPFGSPSFEYWEKKVSTTPQPSLRVEVLGPQTLRYVFSTNEMVSVHTRSSPAYTLAFRNLVITLSGFKAEEKAELEKLVRWMNGTVSASLTKAVTHVVTFHSISNKSIEAHKVGVPVMTAEWVRRVWKDNLENPVNATNQRYVSNTCRLFYNVNFCLSQITAARKATLTAAIERFGGTVKPDLIRGEAHILVVMNPDGAKYKHARKWNLTCVTPAWVENSCEKGCALPLAEYFPVSTSRPVATSTPMHSHIADLDYTNSSVLADGTRMIVNETGTPARTLLGNDIEIDLTLAELKAAKGGYLDGCRIYLVDHEKHEQLKRTLNGSGAVRMDKLVYGVTHVIVPGQRMPKVIEDRLAEMEQTPYIVTLKWVQESARQGSPADEENYKFMPVIRYMEVEDSYIPPQDSRISTNTKRVSETRQSEDLRINIPPLPSVAFEMPPPPSTGTKKKGYASDPTTSTNNGSSLASSKPSRLTKASSDASSSRKPYETGSGTSIQPESSATDTRSSRDHTVTASTSTTDTTSSSASEDSDATPEQIEGQPAQADGINSIDVQSENLSEGLLAGISFQVVLSDAEDKKFVEEVIAENGGILGKPRPDVTILRPVCKRSEKETADKSYTKYWLFDCLETNSLDLPNCFHYMPRQGFGKMAGIMKGVVVAVSQYQIGEREYVMQLISAMGGRYQDVFARKDSGNGQNLRSTHLICKNVETEKVRAAKRWEVPVVVAEWVCDSFDEKKRLPDERYDPSNISGTSDERTVYMPTPQRQKKNDKNTSVGSVFPPSAQKGGPTTCIGKSTNSKPTGQLDVTPEPPPSAPGPSKANRQEFLTPPPPSRQNQATASHKSTAASNAAVLADLFPDYPVDSFDEEDILRQIEEAKKAFPYSDESYERLMQGIRDRGVNLDDVSPFTSFEEARICNPNPDSPLILGMDRRESRAVKEQFEIAMARSPSIKTIKLKPRNSTPLSEMVKRMNDVLKRTSHTPSQDGPSHHSTPKSGTPNLRRFAAFNRLSQGTPNNDIQQDNFVDFEQDQNPIGGKGSNKKGINPLEGIVKLATKRPSDGSPEEDDESKSTKRARKTPDEVSGKADTVQQKEMSPTHCENVQDEAKPSSSSGSKKTNRMRALTDLIACQSNQIAEEKELSPMKRRSGEAALLLLDGPDEDVVEEPRPHISWNDEDKDDKGSKKSTVKKAVPKIRIGQKVDPPVIDLADEQSGRTGRTRSGRAKITTNTVVDEVPSKVTTRRTRSQSKTRQNQAPVGHQPIQLEDAPDTMKTSKKQFPLRLPKNPVLMVSSLSTEHRQQFAKAVEEFGGSVSPLPHYDETCSALVTSQLLRSEKVLCAIGAGKFILRLDYMEKSIKKGYFLPITEEFLWTEDKISSEKEREMARASIYWLKAQMEDSSNTPLRDRKVFLVDPGTKEAAYKRLILAAGGEVVDNMNQANLIIRDEKSKAKVPPGKPVHTPLHLNELILNSPAIQN